MKIYIASSWRNQHAVEMLTDKLEEDYEHEVISFVRKASSDEGRSNLRFDFDEWVNSKEGEEKFNYDINGATKSDLVIYIGPSGKDAAAEIGASFGAGIPVIGLFAKGEDFGLMRRMIAWFDDYREMLKFIENRAKEA